MGLQMHLQSSTNESPFSLVYGANAMIPVEIGDPSLRRELYDPTHNHQNMALHLDLLPELREKAQIRNLFAKQRATRKYNAKLCPRSFVIGDLVWRMASSPPIGTARTAYAKMQEEELIA